MSSIATSKSAGKVAIIMPAFNEAAVIRTVLQDLYQALKSSTFEYEIVVVDDGSQDNTAQHAATTGATVIRHLLNTGVGGATITGLMYCRKKGFDLAATIDADGQHDPRDLVAGLELMMSGDQDLMVGSRLGTRGNMSTLKLIGNRGLSWLTYVLCGIRITDSQSGLRIFSKKALHQLTWDTNGYGFCSEMLWRAKQQGLVIKEFPIQAIYSAYSLSKGQSNWNGVVIVKSLLQRRILEFFGE